MSYKFIGLLGSSLLAVVTHAANVNFQLDLTWGTGAPDGHPREMVLMNGGFPGPQLNLNYGDEVQVVVHNRLPFNVTVHFHGIEQQGTPWSDGVPGVTQEPIKPGRAFEYSWTANTHGIYWYHAHVKSIMQDGLYGAILIKPPPGEPKPFSLISSDKDAIAAMERAEQDSQVALISDWTRFTSEQWFAAEQAANLDIYCMDSILVNGKGAVECLPAEKLESLVAPRLGGLMKAFNTALSDKGCAPMHTKMLGQGDFPDTAYYLVPPGLQTGCRPSKGSKESFKVDANQKWLAMHFIGGTSLKIVNVAIDEHPLWIYAVDGQYIKPQLAEMFTLRNGERYSAMIKLDKTPGDYTIRVANNLPNQLLSGFATLSYAHGTKSNESIPYINYAGNNVTESLVRLDDKLLVPFNAPPMAKTAHATHILTLGRLGANWRWTLNDVSSYDIDLEQHAPLLQNPETAGDMGSGLTITTKNNTWVDLIFVVAIAPSNSAQPEHAMHKHGNKAYLIGRGTGNFTWKSVAEAMKAQPESFNLDNPQYRDTVTTATTINNPSWMAVRYHSQNPGPFIVHCHMLTHQEGGMAVVLMDGIYSWPKVPQKYENGQMRLIS